jgi:hypothetical protein
VPILGEPLLMGPALLKEALFMVACLFDLLLPS